MTRQEIQIDIASLIHKAAGFSSDPMGLARVILDYLERNGVLKEQEG